jgi:hypothetical protein
VDLRFSLPPMSKRVLRASQYFLIMALVVSMGGHFVLLQTIAWGKMLVDFSSESSFSEAIDKTFDGAHPCCLCKAVEKSKKESDKKPLLKSEMKWEVALTAPMELPLPHSTELKFLVTAYSEFFAQIDLAVPMQPPRGV